MNYPSFPEALMSHTRKMNSPTKLMARLRKPVAEHSWMTSPETINAFYTAVMNEIIIPLGILQPPFYKSSRPEVGRSINYNYEDIGQIS